MIYVLIQNSFYQLLAQLVKAYCVECGHPTKIVTDIRDPDALHILVGIHEYFGDWPKNMVAINLEDINESETCIFHPKFKGQYLNKLKKAQLVLDYSPSRVTKLRNMGLKCELFHMGWVKSVDMPKLKHNKTRKIQTLFYGHINQRRMDVLKKIPKLNRQNRLTENMLADLAQSQQITLNLNLYDDGVLDLPMLIFMLAHGAFILSDKGCDADLNSEWEDCINFTSLDDMPLMCDHWLLRANDKEKFKLLTNIREKLQQKLFKLPLETMIPAGSMPLGPMPLGPMPLGPEPDEEIESQYLPFQQASVNIYKNGSSSLVLSKGPEDETTLPTVTVVTLTRGRETLFDMAIRNWKTYVYPRDKLDWIIIDDTPDRDGYDLKSKLPKENVQYVWTPRDDPMPIAEKRNLGKKMATGQIIAHMDDDDYYYPRSIYARVKLLLDYQMAGIKCVGSTHLGLYNLTENYSHTVLSSSLPEATMAYWKEFGDKRDYGQHYGGESIPFLLNRRSEVLVFPFQFNMVAMTHKANITGDLRESHKKEGNGIFKSLDFETQRFINKLYRKLYRFS